MRWILHIGRESSLGDVAADRELVRLHLLRIRLLGVVEGERFQRRECRQREASYRRKIKPVRVHDRHAELLGEDPGPQLLRESLSILFLFAFLADLEVGWGRGGGQAGLSAALMGSGWLGEARK